MIMKQTLHMLCLSLALDQDLHVGRVVADGGRTRQLTYKGSERRVKNEEFVIDKE